MLNFKNNFEIFSILIYKPLSLVPYIGLINNPEKPDTKPLIKENPAFYSPCLIFFAF